MFVLNSDITIGNFQFSGVNEVNIKRSIHSCVETATIKLPSVSYYNSEINSSNPKKLVTGDQFKDGDPVTIKLGYNGLLNEEFRGFVKHRSLDIPLLVECEGYSYNLKQSTYDHPSGSIMLSDLLKPIAEDADITCTVTTDFMLNKLDYTGKTGLEVIDEILKATDNALKIFFIKPDELWVGLLSTAVATSKIILNTPEVKFKLGYNVLKDNSLKQKDVKDNPTIVIYSKKLSNGQELTATSNQNDGSDLTNLTVKRVFIGLNLGVW